MYFPFRPYDSQSAYMTKVLDAVMRGENALLESPTGTGKTLSLLCSSLAWLAAERSKFAQGPSDSGPKAGVPKIIYCSRTHSQLAQVQKEAKNTVFKPRTVLIASRDHLCVNPSINVNKGFALNAACSAAQKGVNPCMYFTNRERGTTDMSWDPMDIEEIHREAIRHAYCPYYATKDRVAGADLVFMPYNYLIDEKIRENYGIDY